MALTVTVDGTRANIQADNFSFNCSMNGSQAIISTPTKIASVTYSDPQAIIQWLGGKEMNVCSSFIYSLTGALIDPIVLPYAAGFTLGTATDFVRYYSYDPGDPAREYQDIGAYGAYFYFMDDQGAVYRVLIDGEDSGVDQSMFCDPNYSNTSEQKFAVVSENVVYVLYHYQSTGTNEMRLAKLNFGTATRTLVAYWNDSASYDGDTKSYWTTAWMARTKADDKDYLIAVTQWLGSSKSDTIRILIYDILGESVIDFAFKYLMGSTDYLIMDDYAFVTRPSMYGSKVIFTAYPSYYDDGSTELPWPSFVVDLADDSITKIGGTRSGSMASPNVRGSGIDQNSGIYYVWISNYDEDGSPHHIMKIDLTATSPAYATSSALNYEGRIAHGETTAYGLRDYSTYWRILGPLPDLTVRDATDNYTPVFIDEANNVGWHLDNSNDLTGYELSGGTDKSINLNWGDTVFKYSSNQVLHPIMIFDGIFVTLVYSSRSSPAAYQRELVIFGA